MGGWIAAYARRLDPGSRAFWAVTPSFFWGALLLGRFVAPLVLRHVREIRWAAAGVALAAFGILLLLAAKTIMFVTLAASLTGLGLAPGYPINVSLLSHAAVPAGKRTPRSHDRAQPSTAWPLAR